jgi:hypothetical protein
MNYHLITIGLMLGAGACIVLFGLGIVGAVFVALAVVLECACWIHALRGVRRRRDEFRAWDEFRAGP